MIISKNLDKTVKFWIKNNIPDYEQVHTNIFVGELSKKSSDSSTTSTHEPLAGHGFKDSIWIFEYDQNIYLGVEKEASEEVRGFLSKTH